MKILISGSTGFIGTPLTQYLEQQGHEIYHLVLQKDDAKNKILWNVYEKYIDKQKIPKIDAVINLAGENIASGKWEKTKKDKIYKSRIEGTKLLIKTLNELKIEPDLWINASAVGYYGNSPKTLNYEDTTPGNDFLSHVCVDWEKEALKANDLCKRVIILRFGMILDPSGGALQKIITSLNSGFGGIIGNGKQYMSWISLDDLLEIITFFLNGNYEGIFNTTSPHCLTNREFTKTLSKTLKKPAIIPVPAFILKVLLGEMAESLLLSSIIAKPDKLIKLGYKFKYDTLEKFLKSKL